MTRISRSIFALCASLFILASTVNASSLMTVEALYPRELSSLFLRGSACGLNWDKGQRMNMVAKADDSYSWTIAVDCSKTDTSLGSLEVKVLIDDDRWMLGANHRISLSATAVAGSNSTAQVINDESIGNINSSALQWNSASAPSTEATLYPWFFTYSGSLTKIENVYSPELHNTRDVIYYTPPSYNENTLKQHRNVLVMHDGQNLFNPLTSFLGVAWMCQDTMDDLIIQGKSDEVIIVGAYNTPDRTDEYTYIYDPSEKAGGKGDLYLDWIESTLLPLTTKSYRVEIQRDTLGILGSSLGGLISCYAGWTRPNVYGKVGCMSSSFWWDDNDFQSNVLTAATPSQPVPHIYVDSGTGEPKSTTLYASQVYEYCVAEGFEEEQEVFQYVDVGGEHSESSWGPRFHVPIEALYPPITV